MKIWPGRQNQIPVEVTYLQMFAAPAPPAAPAPTVQVLRANAPTVSFYRFLYGTVGRPWQWFERLKLDDDILHAQINAPDIEIDVLYVDGVPAGYVEMDAKLKPDVEIAYFGLMPEFIGKGHGAYFLRWALHRAWQLQPTRVWLHTCSLDHPRALSTYQSAGLEAYRRETVHINDPKIEFPHLGNS